MNESTLSSQDKTRKAPTGIDGFDEIAHGGLPRGRTTLVTGGPGTGKTLFALQTLVDGARHHGEPGIFVAFEEISAQVIDNAAGFSWHIEDLVDHGLYLVDARLTAEVINTGDFDLSGLLAGLQAKAEQVGARRIVFDSIDVLLAMLDNPVAERKELYRVHDWLTRYGFTGLITARAEFDSQQAYRHAFLQFMADCVVVLDNYQSDRIVLRELNILKYRGSAHEQNAYPFVIGPDGIEVAYFIATDTNECPISNERVSTGITRLDTMLEGGYYRGSSALVTGATGTAKTSLAGAFVNAVCERGERALYIAFDEMAVEIVRNLASIGLDLERHIKSGMLTMVSAHSEERSADDHLVRIRDLLRKNESRYLVIDPISSIMKAGGPLAALSMAARLADICKANGITFFCTSLVGGTPPEIEISKIHISTITDTWIHLSYAVQGGERNRAISIIKSRGTAHSNQVRELILSAEGVTLSDVYIEEGEVLMGALRMQKETRDNIERARLRAVTAQKQKEFESAQAELEARIGSLQYELEAKRSELEAVLSQAQIMEREWTSRESALRSIRGADDKGPSKE